MNYPEEHPLHGLHPNQASTLAYEHAGSIEGDPVKWGRATIALAYEYKKHLDTVNERHHWLTRAIELSGAPDGADWAGLLEHVKMSALKLKDAQVSLKAERECRRRQDKRTEIAEDKACERANLLNIVGAELPGDVNWFGDHGLVAKVRKLRERAEAAEGLAEAAMATAKNQGAQRDELFELVCEIAAETPLSVSRMKSHSDEKGLPGYVRDLRKLAESAEAKVKAAKARIEELEADARTLRIKHDTIAVQRDQALGLRDKDGMVTKTPTQTDLSRIAADVSRIVAALEALADDH